MLQKRKNVIYYKKSKSVIHNTKYSIGKSNKTTKTVKKKVTKRIKITY